MTFTIRLLFLAAAAAITAAARASGPEPTSAAWLSLLPDGPEKRQFILDCTGCHQFDADIIMVDGHVRTEAEWQAAISRMLGFAGATTGFPVIAAGRDPLVTAAWLARYVKAPPPAVPAPSASPAAVREYLMPEAGDLPHDLAIEPSGSVLITGMFTHVLYRLDPATGSFTEISIPVPGANPRALELDASGRAWVVLGKPQKLAVLEKDSTWKTWDVGMYAHSVALGADRAWFNGHFTHSPELIGWVDIWSGAVKSVPVPDHPTMGKGPGGPIPYEIRVAPDGRLWGGELQGNRVFAYAPATGTFTMYTLPTAQSGPRRFDIDPDGIVWIPAYSSNALVRLDPATGTFTEIPLPVKDAVPYVVRVDPRNGALWIGTSAADALFRYDPRAKTFAGYPLPGHGALVRHMAIDPKTGAVWLAYGESPGMPARVARVTP
jgi:virginiamycin B lyase